MGYLLIGLLVGVVMAGYARSESEYFLYIGPNEEKYKNAYIAILTKGK
jgi:hypothetical protein